MTRPDYEYTVNHYDGGDNATLFIAGPPPCPREWQRWAAVEDAQAATVIAALMHLPGGVLDRVSLMLQERKVSNLRIAMPNPAEVTP